MPVSDLNHIHTSPSSPSMFEQHISSDILLNHELNKIPSGNLYLRQTHTVIQLVEVASPPPRRISSVINSSSAASSSYTSSTSSSFAEQDHQQEEEEESICSSYCSSDVPLDELDLPLSPRTASHPDAFSGKMKRILLWREQSPHLSTGMCALSSHHSDPFINYNPRFNITQTKAAGNRGGHH